MLPIALALAADDPRLTEIAALKTAIQTHRGPQDEKARLLTRLADLYAEQSRWLEAEESAAHQRALARCAAIDGCDPATVTTDRTAPDDWACKARMVRRQVIQYYPDVSAEAKAAKAADEGRCSPAGEARILKKR